MNIGTPTRSKFEILSIILISLAIIGCQSFTPASLIEREAALKFEPDPKKANIYIIRNTGWVKSLHHAQFDFKHFGELAIDSHARIEVDPGEHWVSLKENKVTGSILDSFFEYRKHHSAVKINALAGQNYFVEFNTSRTLRLIDQPEGQALVEKTRTSADKFNQPMTYSLLYKIRPMRPETWLCDTDIPHDNYILAEFDYLIPTTCGNIRYPSNPARNSNPRNSSSITFEDFEPRRINIIGNASTCGYFIAASGHSYIPVRKDKTIEIVDDVTGESVLKDSKECIKL